MASLSHSYSVSANGMDGGLSAAVLTSTSDKILKAQEELNAKYKAMYDYYSDFGNFSRSYMPSGVATASKSSTGSAQAGIGYGGSGLGIGSTMYYQEICKYCNSYYQISQAEYNSKMHSIGSAHGCSTQRKYEATQRAKKEYEWEVEYKKLNDEFKYSGPDSVSTKPETTTVMGRGKKEVQHEKNLRKVYWNYRSRHPKHAA